MSLSDLWFVLFVLIIAAYLILDGFDLGVGILHPFVARNDDERRLILNAIGPIWDGNEVWLVVGGGVLFAAFPIAYAALTSGFYFAFMLVLLAIILRTVAIEFRSKLEPSRWRSIWDVVFFVASLGIAALLGLALGDIVVGVPIDPGGNIHVTLPELLHPYALLIGLTSVAMLTMHGAFYLNLKTEGDVQARVQRWLPFLMGAFAVLAALSGLLTFVDGFDVATEYRDRLWPFLFPALAAIAFVVAFLRLRQGREGQAFLASAAVIGLMVVSVGAGMYPNLLISTTDPTFNMTTTNAASADNTLAILLVVAIIGLPFVLAYTAGMYYIFRGKVRISGHSY
jgi:cytochrome d ubiquinol oxidase subunit II